TKIPELAMTISRSCVLSASILAACAGSALGQARDRFVDASPTGEPLIREWKLSAGETMRIGMNGRPGGGQLDLTPQFVPAGVNPEADSHSSVAYLPDGSAIVLANRASKNLAIFDPATRNLIRNIPLSGSPQSVAVTPDGAKAVTAN